MRLPLYGGDMIEIGMFGALVIGAGLLLVVPVGAWLFALGARKNGALAILLGCSLPQFVTQSPVSLVLSLPALVGAIIAAKLLSARPRRRAV